MKKTSINKIKIRLFMEKHGIMACQQVPACSLCAYGEHCPSVRIPLKLAHPNNDGFSPLSKSEWDKLHSFFPEIGYFDHYTVEKLMKNRLVRYFEVQLPPPEDCPQLV